MVATLLECSVQGLGPRGQRGAFVPAEASSRPLGLQGEISTEELNETFNFEMGKTEKGILAWMKNLSRVGIGLFGMRMYTD